MIKFRNNKNITTENIEVICDFYEANNKLEDSIYIYANKIEIKRNSYIIITVDKSISTYDDIYNYIPFLCNNIHIKFVYNKTIYNITDVQIDSAIFPAEAWDGIITFNIERSSITKRKISSHVWLYITEVIRKLKT